MVEKLEFTKQEFKQEVFKNYLGCYDQTNVFQWTYGDSNKMIVIKNNMDDYFLELLQKIHNLPSSFSVLKPLELVSVDHKIVGYTICPAYQFNMVQLSLELNSKIQLLNTIKKEIYSLFNYGVFYLNINRETVISNGKEITLCNFPSFYFQKSENKIVSEYIFEKMKEQFNIFTISYLNDIPQKKVKKEIEIALNNWFNLKAALPLIGVTDNEKCADICYNIILNSEQLNLHNNHSEQFIIDHLAKEKSLVL